MKNSLEIIKRHYAGLKKFWTPNKQSYAGLGVGYTEPEFSKVFDAYHPELAAFLAQAMAFFAENNL